MKPKDLKAPFRWADRRPLIQQKVLFVPEYYDKHTEWEFPGWQDPSLFGKEGKIYIEYCSGNGAWIVEKAQREPHHHWIAVEIQFERARKIWSKIQNLQLTNLIVVCGEALTFTRHYLASDLIEGIYINFPDPWPKEKHAKHRLMTPAFVEELSRVIKQKGSATLVTDDPPYCAQMISTLKGNPAWQSHFPAPFYATDWPDYGTSYFDQLWREKSRTIHYLHFLNEKS